MLVRVQAVLWVSFQIRGKLFFSIAVRKRKGGGEASLSPGGPGTPSLHAQ